MYPISWHCRLNVERRSMARCPRGELSVDTTHVSDAKITIALPLRNVVGITVTLCELNCSGKVTDLERQTWQAKLARRIVDRLVASTASRSNVSVRRLTLSAVDLQGACSFEVVSCLHTCESASASHPSSHDCMLQTQHSAPLVHVFACINRPVNQSLEALTPAVHDCT
jgi:hypothetical protein